MKIAFDQPTRDINSAMCLDFIYAYQQNLQSNYNTDLEFSWNLDNADKTVLFLGFDDDLGNRNLDDYDLIFLCNTGESLSQACTNFIAGTLTSYKNSYLFANSFLRSDHACFNSTIWWSHSVPNTKRAWLDSRYPGFYEHKRFEKLEQRNKGIIFINGENRSWRHHALQEILALEPQLDFYSNITEQNIVVDTIVSMYESVDDKLFREFVNDIYPVKRYYRNTYYDKTIKIGYQDLGEIVLGWKLMKEYYQYTVVAFPELSWLNHEVAVTEKIFKCCLAGSIPFPIGGAGIHQLYDNLGITTAWHLLPAELQTFDNTDNHIIRYKQIAQAVSWLSNNIDKLDKEQLESIRLNNYKSYIKIDGCDVKKASKILGLNYEC